MIIQLPKRAKNFVMLEVASNRVGTELTFGGAGNVLISAIRESAQDTSNQVGQATPITYDMRCRIIAAAGDKLIGLRNKALLSVAYDTVRP